LNTQALFTPRILTYSCLYCAEEFKDKYCLVGGQYCPYFENSKVPESAQNLSSGALLYESLRQRCVYDTIMANNGSDTEKWFHYVVEFFDHCAKNNLFDEACSEKYLRKVGIDEE